jgi:hypothetical protein
MHAQQAIAAINAKGLQENYKKLVWAENECMEKLEEAVLNCDLIEGEVRDDSPVANAVRMATEAQAKGKEYSRAHRKPDFSPTPTSFWKRQGSPRARSWPSKLTQVMERLEGGSSQ